MKKKKKVHTQSNGSDSSHKEGTTCLVGSKKKKPNSSRKQNISVKIPQSPNPFFIQFILWNCENSCAMRGQSNNGVAHDKRSAHYHKNNNNINDSNAHHPNHTNRSDGSLDRAAHDSKKGCGGSSSGGSGDAAAAAPAVWPPRFMIGLTNKEKEEDFWVLKGSKLPQRPKKRAKFIQRTLNLVSPGTWLCDLTLERYEVREKKVSKKRPRGLKAMSNIDSGSE